MRALITTFATAGLPALLSLSTGPARAAIGDECRADADCDQGLVCEVVGGTACACPSEGPCEPCEAEEFRACVPGPCASDADCGAGLVCVSYEVPCPGVAEPDCPPDMECGGGEREADDCEPTTASVCAPRWVLPCEAAADCGDGFACEPVEICGCSGGSPTDPVDPDEPSSGGGSDSEGGSSGSSGEGAPPPPPEDDACECVPGDTNQCVPIEVACDDDADCADGWSCARAPSVTTCTVPEGGEGACEEVPSEPVAGQCVPSGWYGGAGSGEERGEDFGVPTAAEGVAHNDDGSSTPEDPDDAMNGTQTTPSSGCGGAPGSLVAGLAFVALAWAMRRRAV